jgi:hypothetical protein
VGNLDVMLDRGMGVNTAVQPAFEISEAASHTLQKRGREHREALRAQLIEATVEAIAGGGHPRLDTSRSWA